MEYILGNNKNASGCIFCPPYEKISLKKRLILKVNRDTMVIMNRYPYNNGHLLVAPTRHVKELGELSPKEMQSLMASLHHAVEALRKAMNPGGFNVGLNLGRVAGAGIEDHLHFHIVPRWDGDTNYMTVFGDLRVIPEHLEKTYDRLLPFFQ
jgi:ATP adenylyltransferase